MNIRMLVMDVDGTLTDGKIYITENGEFMKAFDVKDGYAIIHLKENGIIPVIITGRHSKIVEKRAAELKIDDVYQGVPNKLNKLKEIAEKYCLKSSEIAYIGDDINDLECMQWCGLSACPNDAYFRVKTEVNYCCNKNSGFGAVREFIDYFSAFED